MTRCLSFLMLVVFTSALQAQQITITSPPTNAVVPVGQPCTIAWTSQGVPPGTQLRIEVNVAGFENAQPVAEFVPVEAGQYQWLIPWGCLTGSNCTVKILLQSANANSQGTLWFGPPFALVTNPQPALLLHAPVGSEQWPLSATRSVSWEPHNLTGTLTLSLLEGSNVVDTVSGVPVATNRFPYTLLEQLPAGSDYTLRLTSDDTPAATATSPPFSVIRQAPPPRTWTMLFYFDAATSNQETDSIQSMLDLGTLPASTNVNYVCQLARSPDYAVTNYPWWGVKRFVMQPGITPAASNVVQDLGNISMADPENLTDFINWAVENYPAQNYFLTLLDHGSGWSGGLLEDEINGYHWMSTRQLQQALTNADAPMTILGLDMCVEGDIEVAYQLRNAGPRIFLASQFQEARFWPYRAVFQELQNRLTDTPLEVLAALFCNAYIPLYDNPGDTATLTATRLYEMDALSAAVAGFADTMATNGADQAAVRQQANAVASAFNHAIIYCAKTKTLQQQVFGLNIYFPTNPPPSLTNTYGPQYVDFANDSHWASFLAAYFQNTTNSWITDARTSLPGGDPLDLYRFCQSISPPTNTVRLTMTAVGSGSTVPICNDYVLATNGQMLTIQGLPVNLEVGITNYFVRWRGDANAILATNTAAETTVQLTGDALVVAYFATNKNSYVVDFVTEGNGSLNGTNSLVQVVTADGDCSPVTAVPDSGYVFAGWGGDYPATANPLTVANVTMDTTVIAYFWPSPPAISIQPVGAALLLSWPVSPGYLLESSGNLSSGLWTPVPNVTTNSVTLPISSTNQFFRLIQSPNQTY